ncbi:hypothetical protein P5E87_15380 [Clostridium perfringens]|nr:hypothetical protein [Clostridium perfringens]
MESFLNQLTSYNILNNLLPGTIFCYILKYFLNIDLISSNLIGDLFFYYFCGMIISRIGSILIEPLLKKTKFVKFVDYKLFLKASKEDSKISILSETNNMYRTFIALFISILIVKIYNYYSNIYIVLKNYSDIIIIAALLILFLVSYKKQVNYIKDRVNTVLNKK